MSFIKERFPRIFNGSSKDDLAINHPEYATIRDHARKASRIWFTGHRRGRNIDIYNKMAVDMAYMFDDTMLDDHQYVAGLTVEEHLRVIELLGAFVPKGTTALEKYKETGVYDRLHKYLQTLTPFVTSEDGVSSHFVYYATWKTNLPRSYVEAGFGILTD